MTTQAQRIAALQALATEEGIALPWPAAVIAALEEQGHIVDLVNGLVIQNGAEQRVSLTVIGDATAVINRYDWENNQ